MYTYPRARQTNHHVSLVISIIVLEWELPLELEQQRINIILQHAFYILFVNDRVRTKSMIRSEGTDIASQKEIKDNLLVTSIVDANGKWHYELI